MSVAGGLSGVAARTAIAAMGGGVGSKLSGGSFADGAYSAAFFHLFNNEKEAIRKLNLFDSEKDAVAYENFDLIKGKDGLFYVGAHGSNVFIVAEGNVALSSGTILTPGQLAKILTAKSEFAGAEGVYLCACNTGNTIGHPEWMGAFANKPTSVPFAQKLADILQLPVWGASNYGWMYPGEIRVELPTKASVTANPTNPSAWKHDKVTPPGVMVKFEPRQRSWLQKLFGR